MESQKIIIEQFFKKLNPFYNKAEVKNEIDLLDKVIEIYSILNFDKNVRIVPHEKKVLIYYLKRGLNEETLQTVMTDLNYSKNYRDSVNKKLRDKGFLIRDENNQQKFHLNTDLQLLKKKFIDEKTKVFYIQFRAN